MMGGQGGMPGASHHLAHHLLNVGLGRREVPHLTWPACCRRASSLHSRCSRATPSLWSSSGGRWEEVAVPSLLLPATRPSDRFFDDASLCLSSKSSQRHLTL